MPAIEGTVGERVMEMELLKSQKRPYINGANEAKYSLLLYRSVVFLIHMKRASRSVHYDKLCCFTGVVLSVRLRSGGR